MAGLDEADLAEIGLKAFHRKRTPGAGTSLEAVVAAVIAAVVDANNERVSAEMAVLQKRIETLESLRL